MQSLSLGTVSGADNQQLYQQGRIQSSSLSTETYLEELMAGLQRARLNPKHPFRIVLVVLPGVAVADLQGASAPAVHYHLLPLVQLLRCLLPKLWIALCKGERNITSHHIPFSHLGLIRCLKIPSGAVLQHMSRQPVTYLAPRSIALQHTLDVLTY